MHVRFHEPYLNTAFFVASAVKQNNMKHSTARISLILPAYCLTMKLKGMDGAWAFCEQYKETCSMAVTSAGALEVLDTRRWYTQKWGGGGITTQPSKRQYNVGYYRT